MAIGDDFEIQGGRNIRHTSGVARYTVLELHRWLGDLSDDPISVGDDNMDMTRPNPSDKSFDTIINLVNLYNIDDATAQFFYDGSIIQDNGDTIYDGMQVLAAPGMYLEIIQNGALVGTNFWTNGITPDAGRGISHQFMLKVRSGGADIDGRRITAITREWTKTFLEFSINGTARGVNVIALNAWADDLNNTTLIGSLTGLPFTSVALTTAGYVGIDVDNDTVNEFYYGEWTRGTASINEFYERLKYLTRRGETALLYGLPGEIFRGITHEIDLDTISVQDWDQAFEPVSWPNGTGQLLAVNDANAPTKMWIQLLTGVAPIDNEVITGGTSTATAAVNVAVVERAVTAPFAGASTGSSIVGAYGLGITATDLSSADKLFDLTNTQFNPPNFVTFTQGGLVVGDAVMTGPRGNRIEYDNELGGPFVVGETLTFTVPAGTAVVCAVVDNGLRGELWVGPMVTGSTPLDNSTITGGTSGATADASADSDVDLNLRQFTINGALSGAAVTAIIVNEVIPVDTPAVGTVRVLRANNKYTKHSYTSFSGSTYTIPSEDFSTNNVADGANSFLSYIDGVSPGASMQFTAVYAGVDRDLYTQVRDGGVSPIKPFSSPATLTAAGGSSTAVRTSDE